MTLMPDPEKQSLDPSESQLDKASLPPAEQSVEEKQKLWEAYREQQRRRSCPGCGDDGGLL
jgi:hypothetical protein